MESVMMFTNTGSLHETFLLGGLSTCSFSMLCMLLADARVCINWLPMRRFLELPCSSTLLAPVWASRISLAAGCRATMLALVWAARISLAAGRCATLSISQVTSIVGTVLHDGVVLPVAVQCPHAVVLVACPP
jgi:hypothetical protein